MKLRLDTQSTPCSMAVIITTAALMCLGVVMVFSAGETLGEGPFDRGILASPELRQAAFSAIALVTLLIVSVIPTRIWAIRRGKWFQPVVFLALLALTLLVLVLIPGIGEKRNGARRWLSVGPDAFGLGFQPSEVAKAAMTLFLAAWCAWIGPRIRKFWTGLLPTLMIVGLFVGLVGIEDFGTAALLALVGACVVLGAGARIWHLAMMSLPGVIGIVYLITQRTNRMQRLLTFLNPEADPQGFGYQPIQSLLTIASGGWWGRGLGAGVQKYGYLPEGRTDFIFSVICEELGIIGGIAVIGLFAVLLWQGRKATSGAPSDFGRLLGLGVTLMVGFQAAINIAVVTVSVPTKGISLPLVSAGGTGVIFFAILIGLLANVARAAPIETPQWDSGPSSVGRADRTLIPGGAA
ncbi:MAG TPA: putative peptidoglycan glycosyltransferase FtsW [Phycisphaerae bacterium]|nr:putative peptidoglycan glycosyltransferase FtsW [Phycisphaerae bacterium]